MKTFPMMLYPERNAPALGLTEIPQQFKHGI